MRNLCTLVSFVGLSLVAGSAFAQGAGDAKKPAEPAKAAEPAKPAAGADMAAMKPAEEMKQLKGMIGVWNCDGTFTGMGQEHKSKSKATFTSDLDGYFIAGTMTSPKSKEMPMGYRGKVLYGWDAGAKQFVQMGADNMGAMTSMTSKGWSGDAMEWSGKGKMMGMEMDQKETITRKGDRQVHISGSAGSGDQAMKWEMDCKK